LSRNLIDHSGSDFLDGAFETFWGKYVDFAKSPLKLPQKKTKEKISTPASDSPSKEKQKTNSPEKQKTNSLPPDSPLAVDNPLSHQILDSLNRLVTVTGDISTELRKFRYALGKQVSSDSAPAVTEDGAKTAQLPHIVALDFEAYVERKKQPKT